MWFWRFSSSVSRGFACWFPEGDSASDIETVTNPLPQEGLMAPQSWCA
jgi:hypothetical protein